MHRNTILVENPAASAPSWNLLASTSIQAPTLTTSAINTSGASLLLAAFLDYENNLMAVSDSYGNTWVKIEDPAGCSSLFYCIGGTVGSGHTITGINTSYMSLAFAAFSGSPVFDKSSTSATGMPGPLTPSKNGALIVTDVVAANPADPLAGFTMIATFPFIGGTAVGGGFAYLEQSVAAIVNPTWTAAGATLYGSTIISFVTP